MEKIRLGISARLPGEPVRFLTAATSGITLSRTPWGTMCGIAARVCAPEGSGQSAAWGCPGSYAPGGATWSRLMTVRTKIDLTDRMVTWARKRVEELALRGPVRLIIC